MLLATVVFVRQNVLLWLCWSGWPAQCCPYQGMTAEEPEEGNMPGERWAFEQQDHLQMGMLRTIIFLHLFRTTLAAACVHYLSNYLLLCKYLQELKMAVRSRCKFCLLRQKWISCFSLSLHITFHSPCPLVYTAEFLLRQPHQMKPVYVTHFQYLKANA